MTCYRSTMSALLSAALLGTLAACADLSVSTEGYHSPPRPNDAVHGNPVNPLGEHSTVNPLEPSPG